MTDAQGASDELVILANRLPVGFDAESGWRTSPGGLVSALDSVLRDRDAMWIGWGGRHVDDEDTDIPPPPGSANGLRLVEVDLERDLFDQYYEGFSNSTLWPLYHDAIVPPVYHRSDFEAYRAVNARFAAEAAQRAPRNAMVWVHDYQLQLVPSMLRELRPDLRIGFFLHIPFPPHELFTQMPWRRQVVHGLLGADVIGFQTPNGARNFTRLAQRLLGVEQLQPGLLQVSDSHGVRAVVVRAFPIGIHAEEFSKVAAAPQTAELAARLRSDLGDPKLLLLGVDRLDYTKGIDVRIRAVTELLVDGELDADDTVFVQVATPSREGVEEYQRIREEVEVLVSRANGAIGSLGVTPVHYLFQQLPMADLAAAYVAADVMLVTPLRDGMNLVAKEYVACRNDDSGALVLSEFTGAARQLDGAWLVNPYDIEGTKQAILDAVRAAAPERSQRMARMRESVFAENVEVWAADFLAAMSEAAIAIGDSEPDAAGGQA